MPPGRLVAQGPRVAPARERACEEALVVPVDVIGAEGRRHPVAEPGPERERVVVTVRLVDVDRAVGVAEGLADPRRAGARHPRDEQPGHVNALPTTCASRLPAPIGPPIRPIGSPGRRPRADGLSCAPWISASSSRPTTSRTPWPSSSTRCSPRSGTERGRSSSSTTARPTAPPRSSRTTRGATRGSGWSQRPRCAGLLLAGHRHRARGVGPHHDLRRRRHRRPALGRRDGRRAARAPGRHRPGRDGPAQPAVDPRGPRPAEHERLPDLVRPLSRRRRRQPRHPPRGLHRGRPVRRALHGLRGPRVLVAALRARRADLLRTRRARCTTATARRRVRSGSRATPTARPARCCAGASWRPASCLRRGSRDGGRGRGW